MASVGFRIPLLSWLLFASSACGGSAAPPAESPATEPEAEAREVEHTELTANEVVQRLRGNETDLRRCFFANPSVRGAARFSWQLDVTGKVKGVRREASTLHDERIEQCIGEKLSEIRFGDQDKPARARWTFVFRLVDPPEKPKHGKKSAKKKRPVADDERGLTIDPASSGALPDGAIDNVIEAAYPLFARCYRDGVSRNNDLDGTVRLRFVVADSGRVSDVSDGGSDMTDRQVVDCIAEGFYALRFPEPQHGTVSVLYRIGFDAG